MWEYGWDDTINDYNVLPGGGYRDGNFNALVIPSKGGNFDGMTQESQCGLIHHLNQAIGRGVPTVSGHIPVANFQEWPIYVGLGADRHSARYMTDPNFVNKYTGGQPGFPIGSEPNNLLGNYKVNYALPGEVIGLGQFAADQMLFVILEGLCAGYMEIGVGNNG